MIITRVFFVKGRLVVEPPLLRFDSHPVGVQGLVGGERGLRVRCRFCVSQRVPRCLYAGFILQSAGCFAEAAQRVQKHRHTLKVRTVPNVQFTLFCTHR